MKIRYTYHALERMAARDIKDALRHGQKGPAEGLLRKCLHQSLKGDLVVIYNADIGSEFEIITAYWT